MAEHHRKKRVNITRILSTIENFQLQDVTSIYNHRDLSEMLEKSVSCEYFVLLDIYISV